MCHHLGHLGVQTLAHLGAAVVHEHRSVGVDVHQGPGLVQVRQVEGDAELHGHQGQALLEHRVDPIEPVHFGTALRVAAAAHQLFRQRRDHVVGEGLAVGRDVVVGVAIEVGPPHRQCVVPEVAGHLVEDHLDGEGALRPAKAAEGGVGLGVRPGQMPVQGHLRDPVRVVGVAEGPRQHGRRQVGGEARVGDHREFHAQQAAGVVEARFPVELEAVAAAGDHEIVVAVVAQLHGPAGGARRQRRHGRGQGRLRFLAAEAAPHAPAAHLHAVPCHAQHPRHHVLHLAGVLGGALHCHRAIFQRRGLGDLAFQVELFLAAQPERALQAVRRRGDGLPGGARARFTRQVHGRHHVLAQGVRLARGQHGGQGLRLDDLTSPCRRAAGQVPRGGQHHEDGLPQVVQRAFGQHRVVVDDRAAVVGAGDVAGREHRHHPRLGHQRRGVHAQQAPVRHGRQAQRRVQRARGLGQIVGVGRRAGHVQVGGFVRQRASDHLRSGCGRA